MKNGLLILLLSAGLLQSFAQTIVTTSIPDKSVDYSRLDRIDTLVNEYINKGWINGVVTPVIRDNRVIQYKGYGFSDVENKRLMHQDDLFRIASQTKAIVSVGIMQLFEEGKFYLDEPVADFLPAFRHLKVLDTYNAADTTYTTVPAKREITFRDLLTHTSGLDYPGIGSAQMKAIYAKAHIPSGLGYFDYDLKERMEALAHLPLIHQPGEKWTYGLNVDVLGCLVEVISGMDLETYLATKIFRPLGMKDIWFNVPASRSGRLVAASERSAAREVRSEGTFSWGGFFGTTYWADPKERMVCLVMTQQTPNSHVDPERKIEQAIYQSLVK